MKSIATSLGIALLFGAGGAAAFSAAAFEREIAAVDEHLATQEYDLAADALAEAEGRLRYMRWIPRAGTTAVRDVRTRQAALQYWQRQYDALLPRDADPVGAVEGEPVGLQLLVANGAYRAAQARSGSRETTLQALDEAVSGYLTVLKADAWDERAAYNYEFLVRVREELAKGRRKGLPPPPEDGEAANGQEGAPVQAGSMKAFEVYIPLEEKERNDAAEAGKGKSISRKG